MPPEIVALVVSCPAAAMISVVGHRVDVGSGSPSIMALAIADARSSVGFSRREAVSAVKYWNISSSAGIWSSVDVPRLNSSSSLPNSSWVSCSINGKSDSGHAEQRHDHVQRVVHRDLLDEVALGTHLRPSCRRRPLASSSTRTFIARMAFGRNQSAPIARTSRCCGSSMWISVLTPMPAWSSSSSAVTSTGRGELVNSVVGPLDVHDVGVLGDGPERRVARHLDPRNRGVGSQMGQRRMKVRSSA